MSYCADKLVIDTHTHRPTDAADDNTGRPKLASGKNEMIVGLRPALEGFVVTMHEGACETGSQIPTA